MGNEGLNGHWSLAGHPLDDIVGSSKNPVPIVQCNFAQMLNHEGRKLEISFQPEPKLVDFQRNVAHLETKNLPMAFAISSWFISIGPRSG